MLLLDWKTKCGNFEIWIFISCFQEHYVIEMFWEVIKSFSVENQKKFLKWVFSLHISWSLLLVSSWLREKLNFRNITIGSCFFIRFVTGCSRGPLLGFKYLEPCFCIQRKLVFCSFFSISWVKFVSSLFLIICFGFP